MSEDVVGSIARRMYHFIQPPSVVEGGRTWFHQLPPEARSFMRQQARVALEELRQNVTDNMVAAAAELGEADPETIFVVMLDEALKDHIQ